jgi:cytidine deaminase
METKMNLENIPVQELIKSALLARKKSYSPYSSFQVGAAVLTVDNRIYTGCNIENAAYSPGICAERNAIYKAVSEGLRKFLAIAVVGGAKDEPDTYAFPCGVCRQVMREFTKPEEFVIIVAKSTEDYRIYTLEELLPDSFGPDHLA